MTAKNIGKICVVTFCTQSNIVCIAMYISISIQNSYIQQTIHTLQLPSKKHRTRQHGILYSIQYLIKYILNSNSICTCTRYYKRLYTALAPTFLAPQHFSLQYLGPMTKLQYLGLMTKLQYLGLMQYITIFGPHVFYQLQRSQKIINTHNDNVLCRNYRDLT